MVKKPICLVLFLVMILTGCTNKNVVRSNASLNEAAKQDSINNDKSIPFKYAFTGFVSVDNVYNSLPVGTKIFSTAKEWTDFSRKSFPYADIPQPQYSGGIDFSREALVYYSVIDAKADFYSQAYQIDKITLKNQQLNIVTKELDGKLTITANNSENKGSHRYVILVIVEKKYLQNIK